MGSEMCIRDRAYADPLRDAHCRDLTYRTLPVIAASTATQGEVVQR